MKRLSVCLLFLLSLCFPFQDSKTRAASPDEEARAALTLALGQKAQATCKCAATGVCPCGPGCQCANCPLGCDCRKADARAKQLSTYQAGWTQAKTEGKVFAVCISQEPAQALQQVEGIVAVRCDNYLGRTKPAVVLGRRNASGEGMVQIALLEGTPDAATICAAIQAQQAFAIATPPAFAPQPAPVYVGPLPARPAVGEIVTPVSGVPVLGPRVYAQPAFARPAYGPPQRNVQIGLFNRGGGGGGAACST